MKNNLKKIFALATLGLVLAGCESSADKARKPEVADAMVEQSVAACETGPVNGSPEQYAQRLRNILMDTRTADMDLLRQNNITVCLDQRLANQNNGWLDRRMEGVFYNNGGKGSVLTLWDNGKGPSFWSKDASDWGSRLIHNFAYEVRKGRIQSTDAHWYGYEYSYTTSCGKDCTTTNYDVDWTRERRFDKDTIRKNQDIIQVPPLKSARGQW